ncbi:MAG: Xaa-Pro peptidase family protein [Elusimicrobia bacterium]|nr:Xaa-Pro peptidase family protein [Elusimicrobiota bacterium]
MKTKLTGKSLLSSSAVKKLRIELDRLKVQAALFFKRSDIFYLTGMDTAGVLIIKEAEALLYYPATEREILTNKNPLKIKLREYITALPWKEIFNRIGQTGRPGRTGCLEIALDIKGLDFKRYGIIKENCRNILDLDGFVRDMRVIKTRAEVELIKRSASHTVKIMDSIKIKEWEGKTEAALAGYISTRTWENGMSGPAFTPIVSTLKNSVYPHHIPGRDIIRDLVMIDMGSKYKGYCSDLTRTFILDKFINDSALNGFYESLERAKENAVSVLKPGVRCDRVYREAKESLEKDNLADYFIHGLGHGVGIDIHERPFLRAGCKEILKEGMVVTVEPGIYIKGSGGIRLEDMYIITKKGSQKLTKKYL